MNNPLNNLAKHHRLYGVEPREVPVYSLAQTSQYLKIPFETLRSWIKGRRGQSRQRNTFKPIIMLPDPKIPRLSFMNLVEAHVLNGMRRVENVPFSKVRKAIEYLERALPSKHPLADRLFQTDGVDLFIEELDKLIIVSKGGQIAFKEVVELYLRRIDRDPAKHLPIRLYPFLRIVQRVDEPQTIVIDPLVSFGRPVLAKTGVPTAIIAERFYAGDSTNELAKDYGIQKEEIEEAIRYEAPTRKAA